MLFSRDFIHQVKQATDIVKLARRYTELKKIGDGIWQGKCPHPNHEDSSPSFTVWERSQSWACMGCHSGKRSIKHKNYGSDCFALLQWLKGLGFNQAILKLAEEAGIEPEQDKYAELYDQKRMIATAYNQNLNAQVLGYLNERGLDQKEINEWLIGFDGSRISFALFDRYKRVLGFSKRKFIESDKSAPKYKNSPNGRIFNKGSYLYGLHLVNDDSDEVRITEGAMDVIVSSKYGVKNIVATLGTAFTENHVALIKNMNKIPVFCMDGDKAGLASVKKSVDMLSEAGVYSKILILPENKDMADLSNELQEETEVHIQDHSITYGQMLIQDAIKQYDSKVNEVKLKLLPEIKKITQSVTNSDERKIIQDYIYERMGLKL